MNARYLWAALAFAVASQAAAAELKPLPEQRAAAMWAWRVLDRYSYKPDGQAQPIGARPLDAYFDQLDSNRIIFTQSEVSRLDGMRARFDTLADEQALDLPFALFEIYKVRWAEMTSYSKRVLHEPLDFNGTGRYLRERSHAERVKSPDQLAGLWRQRVMNDYLSLRLAGCTEKNIVPVLEHRYDTVLERLNALNSADVLQVFMNGFVPYFDPEGGYVAPGLTLPKPLAADKQGVGLVVQSKEDQLVVVEMPAGGAAERTGQVKIGDRIVGIAQGAGQPMTEVIGWRVDEAVDLLRGAPGSTVVLDILPADAPAGAARKRVSLVRSATPGGENVATSRVQTVVRDGVAHRIGIIAIPTLYEDLAAKKAGKSDYASVSRDVAAHLRKLEQAQVQAVLLDMRNNGGGPLDEAVGLAGLFVPGMPVAQQRTRDGKLTVEKAAAGAPAWNGLLGVLIDKGSASGTELFAAAIQDYGRGVVIGGSSFGRGSVQSFVPLDRFAPSKDVHYGELKMSVAQLFRIDGRPLQQAVAPDVAVPGAADVPAGQVTRVVYREAPVKPVDFKRYGDTAALVKVLGERHEARIVKDTRYQAMLSARAQAEARSRQDEVSLNEAERRRMASAPVAPDARQVQMDEALQILSDAIDVVSHDPAMAGRTGLPSAAAKGAP